MKIRNYILGLFASVAVLAGCEQEPELGPASLRTLENAVSLPLEGGEQTITLKATRPWTATVSPADASITVTPSSGQGSNDPVTITVTAGKNASRNLNGKITFTSGSMKPVVVTVTQPGELGALYYADEIYSLANDTEVIVEGLVVGVNTKGCVIKDDTGLVLAYNGSSTAAPSSVGKKVKVEGKVGIYGDLKQVAYTKLTEDPAEAVEVNHGEPVVADASYLNAPKLDRVYYMTLEGRYQTSESKGKTYHNVIIEGASKQGSLQYHVQDLSSVLDHNVKFYGYFAGGNNASFYNFLVTSYEDLGELEVELSTVAQALAGQINTTAKVKGTVAAVSKKSLILKDETGVIYVYVNSDPSIAVGADVEITGLLTDPYDQGFLQISSPTITPKGTTSLVDHGTAKSIKTLAELTDYMSKPTLTEYVEIEGTVDGYLTYPEGATKDDNSVMASDYDGDITVYQGMKITMCGYSVGKSEDEKKLKVIVTEIKTDPFISAKDVAVSAKTTSARIEVVSNVEWTVSCSAEWITSYAKSTTEEGVIDVAFDANTTEGNRTATFTISAEGLEAVTVTLTQVPDMPTFYTPDEVWNTFTKGSDGKAYNDIKVLINGSTEEVRGFKLSTTTVNGTCSFKFPAGTKKVGFYAAGWNGDKSSLTVSAPDLGSKTVSLVSQSGVASSSPFTITVDKTNYFVVEFTGELSADTSVTFAATKRCIFWGLNVVE